MGLIQMLPNYHEIVANCQSICILLFFQFHCVISFQQNHYYYYLRAKFDIITQDRFNINIFWWCSTFCTDCTAIVPIVLFVPIVPIVLRSLLYFVFILTLLKIFFICNHQIFLHFYSLVMLITTYALVMVMITYELVMLITTLLITSSSVSVQLPSECVSFYHNFLQISSFSFCLINNVQIFLIGFKYWIIII